MHIASETEGMASFGAIAGIAIGLMACVPSLILSVLGLFRNEKPLWPAALGLFLSALPGGIGLYMLALLLKHYL